MSLNKISSTLYKLASLTRWIKAISSSAKTGSPKPILRRIVNVGIGRKIVSKMYLKK